MSALVSWVPRGLWSVSGTAVDGQTCGRGAIDIRGLRFYNVFGHPAQLPSASSAGQDLSLCPHHPFPLTCQWSQLSSPLNHQHRVSGISSGRLCVCVYLCECAHTLKIGNNGSYCKKWNIFKILSLCFPFKSTC